MDSSPESTVCASGEGLDPYVEIEERKSPLYWPIDSCRAEIEHDRVVRFYFPRFTSYSTRKFGPRELHLVNASRLKANTIPEFLELDYQLYSLLHVQCGELSLMRKTFTFKKKFIKDLMELVTLNKAAFHQAVLDFVLQNKAESIEVEDCKFYVLCLAVTVTAPL